MKVSNKLKAVVGGVALVVTALTGALADNLVNASEAQTLAAVLVEAVLGVYAVWRVPNKDA